VTQAEAKADARKAAFARRKQAFDTAPPDTAAHLCRVLAAHRGLPLSGFLPIRTEIDPTPAMAQAVTLGPVGVPVVDGPGLPLRFALWTPGCTLVRGPFGAMIPADPQWMTPRVVIVPLVAFTRAGGRLGYGGGFYDRTLQGLRARHPATLAIGYAFAAQEAPDLPLEPTDQPLDLIVTENGVLTH